MSLVRRTPHTDYWSGEYSKCYVGKDIETYVLESLRRYTLPLSCVLIKSDGFFGQSEYNKLPKVSPFITPESQYPELESAAPPGTHPIVGCLCSRGLDRKNLLHLPLDDETFRLGLSKVLESIPSPVWNERLPIAFWRGASSGFEEPSLRVRVAERLTSHPHADVKLTRWWNWEAGKHIPDSLFAPRCTLAECFQYKYLFILDGNCIASNLQWVFGSGAVPILVTHPTNRFWFQRYLEPMVNYVPVAYDLSDLCEKVEWLVSHDTEASTIAKAALHLSANVFSPSFQRAHIDATIDAIAKEFTSSVSSTAMYYFKEGSLQTVDPVFLRLRSDCMVFPESNVARDFAMRGAYEQSIIDWAKTLIDPSKLFLDIGAHVGTYSLGFANACAGVHSFECSPKTFNYLCANIALRGLDYKITPHRTALGDTTGTIPYYIRSPDGGGNSCIDFKDRECPSVPVPVTTLDSFGFANIGLIKMDVEGFEARVLEGAKETLKANGYPRILFESWREGREAEGLPASRLRTELFETFRRVGYSRITPIRGWDEMFIAE